MSSMAFSVISLIISVFTLVQTQRQIKLSNKHQLFERRLNNFFTFYGLYELYNENRVIFGETRKDNPLFDVDVNFLAQFSWKYQPTFHCKFLQFFPLRQKFFAGQKMASFICEYEKLLQKMYGYKLLLNEMDKQIDRMDLAQSIKCFGEEDRRNDLLMAYAALKDAFEGLEKDRIVERVENLIKLEP